MNSPLRKFKRLARQTVKTQLQCAARWREGQCRRLLVWPAFDSTEEAAVYVNRLSWYLDPKTPLKIIATCRQEPPPSPDHWAWRQANQITPGDLLSTTVHLTRHWGAYRQLPGYLRAHARPWAIGIHEDQREEYKDLCFIQWHLLNAKERDAFIRHNQEKWERFKAARLAEGFSKAYVIGNGPTAGLAMQDDLSDGFRFSANTCIHNPEFMAKVQPHGIVSGDTVWHFGYCSYAKRYQQDVRTYLAEHDATLFVPLPVAYPMVHAMQEVEEKIIYIPMQRQDPVFDLSRHFILNQGVSVLNTLMLPVAGSLVRDITLYGIDGQAPKVSENDIWDHAVNMQYSMDLVATGHEAHPSFDRWRQKRDEVASFYEATERSINGLLEQGYQVHTAATSYIPCLRGLARTSTNA